MTKWKPSAAEKRAIRNYAGLSEGRKGSRVHIETNLRYNMDDGSIPPDENLLLVRNGADDARTDLYDTGRWGDLNKGITLTDDGRAEVEFVAYERGFYGDHGDLLTHVQAHVEPVNGKPRLVRLTGTMVPDATGDVLEAFALPDRDLSLNADVRARLGDWSKRKREMWR